MESALTPTQRKLWSDFQPRDLYYEAEWSPGWPIALILAGILIAVVAL
jgi:hypothetical protein